MEGELNGDRSVGRVKWGFRFAECVLKVSVHTRTYYSMTV